MYIFCISCLHLVLISVVYQLYLLCVTSLIEKTTKKQQLNSRGSKAAGHGKTSKRDGLEGAELDDFGTPCCCWGGAVGCHRRNRPLQSLFESWPLCYLQMRPNKLKCKIAGITLYAAPPTQWHMVEAEVKLGHMHEEELLKARFGSVHHLAGNKVLKHWGTVFWRSICVQSGPRLAGTWAQGQVLQKVWKAQGILL